MDVIKQTIAVLFATALSGSVGARSVHLAPASLISGVGVSAQQVTDPNITEARVIGQVIDVDQIASRIVVKTESGNAVTILLDDKTDYLRVPPGAGSLEKAVKITRNDIGPGDKVYARGKVSEDRKSVPAQKMIVMLKADIEKDQQRQQNEWQRRGIAGSITALNPKTGEVTVHVRGRDGLQAYIITTTPDVKFRRYAPDSVKFSDARPSLFGELKLGDQLCALGEKQADGTHFSAEQVVFGSFRTATGTVTSIDATAGEIHITTLGKNQILTVVVSKDSRLQRITPQAAQMIAGAARISRLDGREGAVATRPSGNASSGGGDLQRALERLPALTLSEIKAGDTLAVTGTVGSEPSRLTAIILVNGVDAVLIAIQSSEGRRNAPGMDWGVPPGLLDTAIVRP